MYVWTIALQGAAISGYAVASQSPHVDLQGYLGILRVQLNRRPPFIPGVVLDAGKDDRWEASVGQQPESHIGHVSLCYDAWIKMFCCEGVMARMSSFRRVPL